jgi:hypothetical protein
MELDELEVIVPRLEAVQSALAVLPDLCDEVQAEMLRDMTKDLRAVADLMEGMK